MNAMYRSLIFVPANNKRRIAKALTLEADGAIVDLEDACPISEKVTAREGLRGFLAETSIAKPLFVRVNALKTEFCFPDIQALALPCVTGLMVPKIETASQIETIDWLLIQLERERGLAIGQVELMPLVETVTGISNARSIAAASRLVIRAYSDGAGH
jgi:citrate lyase subunit beta/citryl-CoA lyase